MLNNVFGYIKWPLTYQILTYYKVVTQGQHVWGFHRFQKATVCMTSLPKSNCMPKTAILSLGESKGEDRDRVGNLYVHG